MLTLIKKIFAKKKITQEVVPAVENRNPNFVTDPSKVIHLLSANEADTAAENQGNGAIAK